MKVLWIEQALVPPVARAWRPWRRLFHAVASVRQPRGTAYRPRAGAADASRRLFDVQGVRKRCIIVFLNCIGVQVVQ
jgi:hypothetical protein